MERRSARPRERLHFTSLFNEKHISEHISISTRLESQRLAASKRLDSTQFYGFTGIQYVRPQSPTNVLYISISVQKKMNRTAYSRRAAPNRTH